MSDQPENIEEFWRELRPIEGTITHDKHDPSLVIQKAVERFTKQSHLVELLRPHLPDPNGFLESMGVLFKEFAHLLLEEQRKDTSNVLLHLLLESENLDVKDLKGYIQGLPRGTLLRMLTTLGTEHSGLHALVSIEELRRRRILDHDYEVSRDSHGKVSVSFRVPQGFLSFHLREVFQAPKDTPPNDDGTK